MNKRNSSKGITAGLTAMVLLLLSGITLQVRAGTEFTPDQATPVDVDGDGTKEDVYLWSTADNWAGDEIPDTAGGAVDIPTNGSQRCVVIEGNEDESFSYGEIRVGRGADEYGELELRMPSGDTLVSPDYVSTESDTSLINHYSGTFDVDGPFLGVGVNGDGEYNLYGGTLNTTDTTLSIGMRNGNNGTMNVRGGTVTASKIRMAKDAQRDSYDSGTGTLYIAGSAPSSITATQFTMAGDKGRSGDRAILDIGVDSGGVTPVDVSGDVSFENGTSDLDVRFLEGSDRVGSWEILTWEGELTNNELHLADTVDKSIWNMEFLDTDDDGSPDSLYVNAVPNRAERIASVKRLSGQAPDRAIRSALTILRDDRLEERRAAVETLKQMGRKAAPVLSGSEGKSVMEVMLNDRGLQETAVEAVIAAGVVTAERLALNHENQQVRMAAIRNITDRDMLRRIATDRSENPRVRRTAIQGMTDRDVLRRIATNKNEHKAVRDAAGAKIPGTYWRFPEKTRKAYPLPGDSDVLDRLVFGSKPSEQAHDLAPETSFLYLGQHETVGRRLRVPDVDHEHLVGSVSFTMKCDPDQPTHLTIKLEADPPVSDGLKRVSPLLLFHGSDQVGLNYGREHWPSIVQRNFFYNPNADLGGSMVPGTKADWVYFTMVLPESMTAGKETVDLRLGWRKPSVGNFTDLNAARSLPFYRAYTHTNPLFRPPSDEEDTLGRDVGTVSDYDRDPVDVFKERSEEDVAHTQQYDRRNGNAYRALRSSAVAYSVDWLENLDRDKLFAMIRNSIDQAVLMAVDDDKKGRFSNGIIGGWHNGGAIARAFELLAREGAWEERGALEANMPTESTMKKRLNSKRYIPSTHPDHPISRREAYARVFRDTYDRRVKHPRDRNTNQAMFIYLACIEMAEALETLATGHAPPAEEIDTLVNMTFALEPQKPFKAANPSARLRSRAWYTLSKKGLNREPRYSAGYGPKFARIATTYIKTTGDQDRAERVKERLSDFIEAMGEFRSLAQSNMSGQEGNTVAYQEAPIGSRGDTMPGKMNNWFGYGNLALAYADILGDDDEVARRWAELFLEHGRHELDRGGVSWSIWMKEGAEALQEMEPSTYQLPWERERSVWADHTAGMVDIVDGDHRLMVSLGHGVRIINSDTVRFDYEGPEVDCIGTTLLRRKGIPLWKSRKHPNNINVIDGGGLTDIEFYFPWTGETGMIDQELKSRKIDFAAQPNGEPWPGGGQEMSGLIYFYREAKIGPYLIGMNSTGAEKYGFGPGKEYQMDVPEGGAIDVATGERVPAGTITIGPEDTRVLNVKKW